MALAHGLAFVLLLTIFVDRHLLVKTERSSSESRDWRACGIVLVPTIWTPETKQEKSRPHLLIGSFWSFCDGEAENLDLDVC